MTQPTGDAYDAIIIGAGQSGGPLSTALAGAGRRTALVERQWVGGSCINYGCTPTKTMVASARVAYLARRGADYGVRTGPITIDMERVRQRKREIVESFRSGSERRVREAQGLDLIFAEASFTSPHELELRLKEGGTRRISAPMIFINTGLRPVDPQIPGLEKVPTLDSTAIQELAEIPEHLVVLGGGYIGVEFGQMFRRFGSNVTIIQRGPRIVDIEDPEVSEEVTKILREDGIEVLVGTQARRADAAPGGCVRLTVATGDRERDLVASHVLKATGRAPDTEPLNLAAVGVETDQRGAIRVNDRLETNLPGVYAMGDVKGGPAFTHISYDDYRILKTNLIDGGNTGVDDRPVPYTVFIDPQLGRVGLTETKAREQGRNIRVAKMPMSYVARALEMDESRGLMKVVVDADTDQILGCAVLGVEGGEVMSILQVAMMGKLPYTALRDGIFAHPTLAESLNNLFAKLE